MQSIIDMASSFLVNRIQNLIWRKFCKDLEQPEASATILSGTCGLPGEGTELPTHRECKSSNKRTDGPAVNVPGPYA